MAARLLLLLVVLCGAVAGVRALNATVVRVSLAEARTWYSCASPMSESAMTLFGLVPLAAGGARIVALHSDNPMDSMSSPLWKHSVIVSVPGSLGKGAEGLAYCSSSHRLFFVLFNNATSTSTLYTVNLAVSPLAAVPVGALPQGPQVWGATCSPNGAYWYADTMSKVRSVRVAFNGQTSNITSNKVILSIPTLISNVKSPRVNRYKGFKLRHGDLAFDKQGDHLFISGTFIGSRGWTESRSLLSYNLPTKSISTLKWGQWSIQRFQGFDPAARPYAQILVNEQDVLLAQDDMGTFHAVNLSGDITTQVLFDSAPFTDIASATSPLAVDIGNVVCPAHLNIRKGDPLPMNLDRFSPVNPLRTTTTATAPAPTVPSPTTTAAAALNIINKNNNKPNNIYSISLAAGTAHACAVVGEQRKALHCWGANADSQMGASPAVIGKSVATPSSWELLTGVKVAASGDGHTCAVLEGAEGAVKCVGRNSQGQAGVGNVRIASVAPFSKHSVLVGAVDIAAGFAHTCALMAKNGGVRCWGLGSSGQLGVGESILSMEGQQLNAPPAQDIITGVRQLAAGAYHTCVLMEATSGVRCYGLNAMGQLGTGNTENLLSPPSADVLTGVKQVAAGMHHTCALLADAKKSVVCWGSNSHNQLGLGSSSSEVALLLNPPTAPVVVGVDSIAAGASHTCVLKSSDGGVVCWGLGTQGQLGLGKNQVTDSIATPPTTSIIAGAKAVVAGGAFTCVLMADTNGARCFGQNSHGELGIGSHVSVYSPPDADISFMTVSLV